MYKAFQVWYAKLNLVVLFKPKSLHLLFALSYTINLRACLPPQGSGHTRHSQTEAVKVGRGRSIIKKHSSLGGM